MKKDAGADRHRIWADQLRQIISKLFLASPAERILLTPGILVALKILFGHFGIRRLALSDEEYYGAEHFPNLEVIHIPRRDFISSVKETRPDAVIASVVGWRGCVMPVQEWFEKLRGLQHSGRPLLIADYSHAGAAGFPCIAELRADLVCGDSTKWILDHRHQENLAFLWFGSEKLFDDVRSFCAPFYLALHNPEDLLFSRWVEPRTVRSVLRGIGRRLDREILSKLFARNMEFSAHLSDRLGGRGRTGSAILWFSEGVPSEEFPRWMSEHELVWQLAEGPTRILCRADLAP